MKVGKSGMKGIPGAPTPPGNEGTLIQKNGDKITLTPGENDSVVISQKQNKLLIAINDEKPLSLTPEESKKLEIDGKSEKIQIDSSVTLPIGGITIPEEEATPFKQISPTGSGRKGETALTASFTREFLKSELKHFEGENPVHAPQNATENALPLEQIEINVNTLRGPEITTPSPNAIQKPAENVTSTPEPAMESSTLKEEGSLIASVKKNFLNSEIGPIPEKYGAPDLNAKGSEIAIESLELTNEGIDSTEQKTESTAVKGELPLLEKKAELLQNLSNKGSLSFFEERSIPSVLLGAENGAEFRAMLPEFTGLRLSAGLRDPEIRTSWDRIMTALNRPELAFTQEKLPDLRGLLLQDPATLSRLIPGCEVENPQDASGPLNVQDFFTRLDRPAFCSAVLENKIREIEGRPMLQVKELREQSFDIITDNAIPPEEKKVLLDALKMDSKLTDLQMHEIVGRPLTNLFEKLLFSLSSERDSIQQSMESRVKDAVSSFGPQSVAVEIAKAEHQEVLGAVQPRIDRFEDAKSISEQMFSGPSSPPAKLDRFFENVLTSFFPITNSILPETTRMFPGGMAFQNGKLEMALGNLAHADVPEIKPFAQSSEHFVANVMNGNFPVLLTGIVTEMPEPDRLPPQVHNAAKFFEQLSDGRFTQQLQLFVQLLKEHEAPPAFREIISQAQDWRSKITNSPAPAFLQQGEHIAQELLPLVQQNIPAMSRDAGQILEDPRFTSTMDMVRTGGDVVMAFRNGHFVQLMMVLNQRMAGSVAVQQIIEQALHITNAGTPFFRGLLSREWERPVFGALKKNPGNKELQEVSGILVDTLNLFLPLTGVESSTPFLQYEKQLGYLKDVQLMDDWIHQFSKSL